MDNFRVFWMLTLFLVSLAVPCSYAQQACFHNIKEDVSVGSVLFNISEVSSSPLTFASDLEPTKQLVNISDSYNTSLSDWHADIILKTELDRDYEPAFRYLIFEARHGTDVSATISCTIRIQDVNDNDPIFQGQPYELRVFENETIGTILAEGLHATDPDDGVSGTVRLDAEFPDESTASVFNASKRLENGREVMDIILNETLDYETHTFYMFTLVAEDGGGRNSSANVRVSVLDIQDTPPVFQLPGYRANITEHLPVGTPIVRVSAEDGDRGIPNGITYSIVKGNTTFFAVDNQTGLITSLMELDRDDVSMVGSEGAFEITVRAEEVNGTHPQYGNTTTDVFVLIVVEDINDNSPTFGSSVPYTAFLREDSPAGSLVFFQGEGYMFVSDADQGRNAYFNLSVEKDGVPWPVLAPTPVEVYSDALVLLRVIDADAIRAAVGTHITFQVVAREISTKEHNARTAEVVIAVERVTEETTTPAPQTGPDITAPDVVVFIIGFLVVFNIVVSALIIWYMRKRSREPKQGLVRHGSKYYVNGAAKKESTGNMQNGSVVSTRPESVVVEVDAKDRCDVVPLNERRSFGKGVVVTSPQEDENHNQTKLKAPLIHKGKAGGGSVLVTQADVNAPDSPSPASLSSALAKNLGVAINTSTAGTTFINPVHETNSKLASPTSSSSSTMASGAVVASRVAGGSAQSDATQSARTIPASSIPKPPPLQGSAAAAPATSKSEATSPAAVPVTKFSAKGSVETNMQPVPDGAGVSTGNTSSGQSGTGSSGSAQASTSKKSTGSELPY